MNKLQNILAYLAKLDISMNVKINGRKINALIVFALLILGIKAVIDIFRRHVISTIWNIIESGWKGGLQSMALFGGYNTQTERSSIIVDNWPSMKQVFRTAFRPKIQLLDHSKYEENHQINVIIYGACSHMGQTSARVMLKYGYSVILVDQNLHKL